MFTRNPGTIRPADLDGEDDKPITPVPARLPLTNENGEPVCDENGEPIYI